MGKNYNYFRFERLLKTHRWSDGYNSVYFVENLGLLGGFWRRDNNANRRDLPSRTNTNENIILVAIDVINNMFNRWYNSYKTLKYYSKLGNYYVKFCQIMVGLYLCLVLPLKDAISTSILVYKTKVYRIMLYRGDRNVDYRLFRPMNYPLDTYNRLWLRRGKRKFANGIFPILDPSVLRKLQMYGTFNMSHTGALIRSFAGLDYYKNYPVPLLTIEPIQKRLPLSPKEYYIKSRLLYQYLCVVNRGYFRRPPSVKLERKIKYFGRFHKWYTRYSLFRNNYRYGRMSAIQYQNIQRYSRHYSRKALWKTGLKNVLTGRDEYLKGRYVPTYGIETHAWLEPKHEYYSKELLLAFADKPSPSFFSRFRFLSRKNEKMKFHHLEKKKEDTFDENKDKDIPSGIPIDRIKEIKKKKPAFYEEIREPTKFVPKIKPLEAMSYL